MNTKRLQRLTLQKPNGSISKNIIFVREKLQFWLRETGYILLTRFSARMTNIFRKGKSWTAALLQGFLQGVRPCQTIS